MCLISEFDAFEELEIACFGAPLFKSLIVFIKVEHPVKTVVDIVYFVVFSDSDPVKTCLFSLCYKFIDRLAGVSRKVFCVIVSVCYHLCPLN